MRNFWRNRCHLAGGAVLFWLLGIAAAVAQEGQAPAEVLARHDLVRIDRVWLLPLEVELRQELAELPKRRERILAVERELDERIEANRRAWQDSRAGLAALKQALVRLSPNEPQRAVLQKQIDAVERSAVEPARLGAKSDVRSRVTAWTAERHGLALAAARLRRALPKLIDEYAAVAETPEVKLALRRAGERQRLGPQRSYQAEMQRLAEYERLVFTRWVPMHWQSGHVRVTGLVNDWSPITFSWIEASQQQTLITATAAERAGLSIPADAPSAQVTLAGDRRVTARRITVPYLRLGACVLRNVSALVLPPEAEDWGSRIGREALAEHSVRVEAERLRLWIDGG